MNNNGILTTHQRSTHTYVIGQPGTGKSRALESWIMQDISAGRGVCVIKDSKARDFPVPG